MWIAFRFCIFVLWTQSLTLSPGIRRCCELLSDFVYSFFEHNLKVVKPNIFCVVNCFQILYIRSLNTMQRYFSVVRTVLWIAFRFCIFVLWTQYAIVIVHSTLSCELLSDFVYSFFEHNGCLIVPLSLIVVNCFQILYIRSLNTMGLLYRYTGLLLWIAFRFCIFVLWTQSHHIYHFQR